MVHTLWSHTAQYYWLIYSPNHRWVGEGMCLCMWGKVGHPSTLTNFLFADILPIYSHIPQ